MAKLKLGGHFKITCRASGSSLTLVTLGRVDTPGQSQTDHGKSDPGSGTTSTHGGGSTTTETPPPPPPPPPTQRDGHGVVSALSSTGVTLTLDGGGAPLSCAITPAPDSAAAAAKLTLGAHVGIVCRLDGTRYVLSGATPIT